MTPDEARVALEVVSTSAGTAAAELVTTATVDELLEAVPVLTAYYSDGTAALAADFYEDRREAVGVRTAFRASPVIDLNNERIRRGILWAIEGLVEDGDVERATGRLAGVVQLETARSFRETIRQNRVADEAAIGWRRIAKADACKFCLLLAGRGAIYTEATARFAAHKYCSCSAAPVFQGETGPEASVMQYVASQRRRSDRESAMLRDYLNKNFPNAPG